MQPNQKIFYIEYFFAILIKHIYVSTANSLVKHSDQSRPIFQTHSLQRQLKLTQVTSQI